MPTEEQLIEGLRRADAAGNTEDAQAFADAIKGMRASAQTPQPVPVTPQTNRPVAHTGYAAQVRANMTAPEESGRELAPWSEVGTKYGNMAGGGITGVALGVPSAIAGAPGDIEGIGRSIGHVFNPSISRDTFMPTSSSVMNSIAGEPATPEAAYGRFLGSMASPSAYAKGADILSNVAGFVGKHALGLTTGQGARPFQEAYAAGKEGGDAGKIFQANVTNQASPKDLIDTAEQGLAQLKAERSDAYTAGINKAFGKGGTPSPAYVPPAAGDLAGQHQQMMSDLASEALQGAAKNTAQASQATKPLPFQPIDDALRGIAKTGTYQGKSLSDATDKVREKISNVVDDWRQSDPKVFHTVEGLDALKKKINYLQSDGSLKDIAAPGTPGAVMIQKVRDAISGVIKQEAPDYAKVMADYSNASDQLDEIKATLSVGGKASTDTALRKLTSLMRDNVNTNYGQRVTLGELLDAKTGGKLMPAIAGQTLKPYLPQGIARLIAGGEIGETITQGGAIPSLVAGLTASSPHLMGQAAYGLGSVARGGQQMAGALGNATGISRAAIPALINSPQLMARLLAQQPANAAR